jgi:hypothetical protein
MARAILLGIDAAAGVPALGSVKAQRWSVQRGLSLDSMWEWSVPGLVGQTRSGKAVNHATGVNLV